MAGRYATLAHVSALARRRAISNRSATLPLKRQISYDGPDQPTPKRTRRDDLGVMLPGQNRPPAAHFEGATSAPRVRGAGADPSVGKCVGFAFPACGQSIAASSPRL